MISEMLFPIIANLKKKKKKMGGIKKRKNTVLKLGGTKQRKNTILKIGGTKQQENTVIKIGGIEDRLSKSGHQTVWRQCTAYNHAGMMYFKTLFSEGGPWSSRDLHKLI